MSVVFEFLLQYWAHVNSVGGGGIEKVHNNYICIIIVHNQYVVQFNERPFIPIFSVICIFCEDED